MIVVTTWLPPESSGSRRHALCTTLGSWEQNLLYSEPVALHIADDGTRPEDAPDWSRLTSRFPIASFSTQNRMGVGASLNAGFKQALKASDVILYAVDDWALKEPFDLTPWVDLLVENEWLGMVRLGPPHPNVTGRVQHFDERWGLVLDRYSYAFAHRPALYHRRFIEAYGWFQEEVSAMDCELDYAKRFVDAKSGPEVMLALPHPWDHVGSVELGNVDPKAVYA